MKILKEVAKVLLVLIIVLAMAVIASIFSARYEGVEKIIEYNRAWFTFFAVGILLKDLKL